MSDVQTQKPAEKKAADPIVRHHTPAGSNIRIQYRWNKDKSGLVKVGEVDVQKEIDAAAQGMRPGDQITRLLRGDTSVLLEGEGFTGDLTGNGEKTTGEVIAEHLVPMHKATAVAQASNMSLSELETEIAKMEADLAEKKKAAEAAKGEFKPEGKEEVKENA